ncbi:MAG: hypothetical protein ACI837_000719 [Crocinitomicaceae bacterium]|jgi:hypothetical protein
MMKNGIILIGLTGLVLSACIKHEVIPAPTPQVDLYSHFFGVINNTDTEWTQNVLGYGNSSTKVKFVLPPGSISTAVYYSTISSSDYTPRISVGLGNINFDSGVAPDPTLLQFNAFFPANNLPLYENGGNNGFEVVYTADHTGPVGGTRDWKSSSISFYTDSTVAFTGIKQESDETGDYSKFICTFDCMVYSLHPDSLALLVPVLHVDSLIIEDAVYEGWFKR